MILTSGIERTSAPRTITTAPHVLIQAEHVLTLAAQDCECISLQLWPDTWGVRFLSVVAGNAGVELLAAKVLDGDYVEGTVVMCALCERSERDTMNCWRLVRE